MREEFLQKDESAIKCVEKEIEILRGIKHKNIVNILGYGSDGLVKKKSGREVQNLVYIILEYVSEGILFDLIETCDSLGEDGGRFFMT